jgi:DNA-binding NtrC family response regulator
MAPPNRKPTILLVDDDTGVRFGLAMFLARRGHVVVEAGSCTEALAAFDAPDLVLLDFRLPDGDSLEVLAEMRRRSPDVPIVMLTAHGSIPLAVEAVKRGATDFVTKPVEPGALYNLLTKVAAHPARAVAKRSGLVGASSALASLRAEIERLHSSDAPVLLLGETGTGKSLAARQIHELGPRRKGRFVELNCAALTRDLVESELFGHERGAFTGAHATKPGLFEYADGGTLFLDEIGDIDAVVQAKLLKVLEEKRFRRVGDSRERTTDVRVITATHRDLATRMRTGDFRSDLYFRISTICLKMPPLRERRDDIPALAEHLLASMAASMGRGELRLDDGAVARLLGYSWPGNVRELRNVLERALLVTRDAVIRESHLRFDDLDAEAGAAGRTWAEIERASIESALKLEHGRVESAARRLGLPRSTLYQKVKALGIDLPRLRSLAKKLPT